VAEWIHLDPTEVATGRTQLDITPWIVPQGWTGASRPCRRTRLGSRASTRIGSGREGSWRTNAPGRQDAMNVPVLAESHYQGARSGE
jgi:hypothetical protein